MHGHVHCDEGICTYTPEGLDALRHDPARCIRHGALLVNWCSCPEGSERIEKREQARWNRRARRREVK